jgi:hypothetical protein
MKVKADLEARHEGDGERRPAVGPPDGDVLGDQLDRATRPARRAS